jgi:two-component system OmpR family sensor kinase
MGGMSLEESVGERAFGPAPIVGRDADLADAPFLVPTEVPAGPVDPNAVDLNGGAVASGSNGWDPPPAPPADAPTYWVPPQGPSGFGSPTESLPGPSARRARRSLLPRTLRWRLVTGVVALVVVIVAIVGVATYAALGSFLTDRLDQQLSGTADNNRQIAVNCALIAPSTCDVNYGSRSGAVPSTSSPMLRGSQRFWFAVLDRTGQDVPLVSRSADLIILDLSAPQRQELMADPTATRDLTSGGETIRVTGRAISTPIGTVYEIAGLSRGDVDNTLSWLLWLELGVGAGGVLLAAVVTSFGVQLSLRPLTRVTTTARAVSSELSPEGAGLDRRVPVA